MHVSRLPKPQRIFSSLNGGITRVIDVRLVGKRASVCGYGEHIALPLSVVVVLACYLLALSPSAPFRRAEGVLLETTATSPSRL